MKELLDLEKIWQFLKVKWKDSFGWVVIAVIMFFFGIAWEQKQTTDDCKYIGSFRDGPQAYSCQVRIK